MGEQEVHVLSPTRDYQLRLRIEYKAGGALELEGMNPEDLVGLANMGVRIMWPNSRGNAVSLEEINEWLGWDR